MYTIHIYITTKRLSVLSKLLLKVTNLLIQLYPCLRQLSSSANNLRKQFGPSHSVILTYFLNTKAVMHQSHHLYEYAFNALYLITCISIPAVKHKSLELYPYLYLYWVQVVHISFGTHWPLTSTWRVPATVKTHRLQDDQLSPDYHK